MDARRSRLPRRLVWREPLALTATIVVAAATRLVRLDLMEFKADEAEACRLALHVLGHAEPGLGTFLPTTGLEASVEFPNPPLFPYLLAAPLALVRSPLAAAAFVALANVVGVWLCYLAGKRYFSTFVGLCSAALFAVSPWAIVYSRKIWAQDLLPPVTCLFLLALHSFLVEKRPRAVLWLLVLVAAATQLHFSAWVLAVVLGAALVMGRDALAWRWVGLGAAAALLLYAPYVWHLVAVGREASPGSLEQAAPAAPSVAHRFLTSARDTLAISGGDRLSGLLGSQPLFALPLSVLLGAAGSVGVLASRRRAPSAAAGRARLLLAAWYVLPLTALTLVPVAPFPHYFIVLFPLPFLGLALVLQELTARWEVLGRVALGACLAAFAALDVWMLRTVLDHGGAPADYGVAYRHKADAAGWLVDESPGRRIRLAGEVPIGEPARPEYRFLVWNERGATIRALRRAQVRYVVSESFEGIAPVLRHPEVRRPIERFGSVQVGVVPLDLPSP